MPFIVLISRHQRIVVLRSLCCNLHPTKAEWFKIICFRSPRANALFRSLILFLWHPCGDNYFFEEKLFLTVFCHFVFGILPYDKKWLFIFYKSMFLLVFFSFLFPRHGKNWYSQNWIGMWIWSFRKTILICSASIWISCQRLMMPIKEVPPRMKIQVMIYHTRI